VLIGQSRWHLTCTPNQYRGLTLGEKTNELGSALSIFAPVEGGEGITALLLTANLFLLMTPYYLIKPVRDCLILGNAGPPKSGSMQAPLERCFFSL
jgi:hypothetical protein